MYRNHLPPIPPIEAKVAVHGDNNVPGIEFAHSYQTEIGQIWAAVTVAPGEFCQRRDVAIAVKGQAQHLILQQCENVRTGLKLKRGFSQNSFACQQGISDSLCHIDGPNMVLVVPPGECHYEPGIGNASHERENPLREETSGGPPVIAPAWRRKGCFPPLALAVSSCSRMRRPTGMPVRREVSFSQSTSSSVRRIVNV